MSNLGFIRVIADEKAKDLIPLKELTEEGMIKQVIGRSYSLQIHIY